MWSVYKSGFDYRIGEQVTDTSRERKGLFVACTIEDAFCMPFPATSANVGVTERAILEVACNTLVSSDVLSGGINYNQFRVLSYDLIKPIRVVARMRHDSEQSLYNGQRFGVKTDSMAFKRYMYASSFGCVSYIDSVRTYQECPDTWKDNISSILDALKPTQRGLETLSMLKERRMGSIGIAENEYLHRLILQGLVESSRKTLILTPEGERQLQENIPT